MIRQLYREQTLAGDLAHVWEFFASPQNLNAITPSNLTFRIVGAPPSRMYAGQMIEYRIGVLPGITTRWLTEITHVRELEYFVDEQRVGPYRLWHHEHHFAAAPNGAGVIMTDRVTYEVGFGPIGEALHAAWIGRQLKGIFNYRAARIGELFPDRRS
jgi:ligand-binding SRPBCC domain-containing protein